jgi:hypothetical protein
MDRRVAALLIAALGVALTLPSLGAGFYLDDYVLWAAATGAPGLRDLFPRPLDPFAFIDGDPARTRAMMDRGILPWWTPEHARLAFWRPATALTHRLDFALWPGRPALMHLQSVLWFGALLAVLTITYEGLTGRGATAALAALFYAANAANALGVAWIASRSVVLSTLFGALTLWAHDRWRRTGWRPGRVVSPLCLALALACAEGAVAITAYLFAHAIFLDSGTVRRRLAALLPCAGVCAGWLLLHRGLGYGLFAVAPMFVNPVDQPWPFARRLAEHGPLLLASQWLGLPLDTWTRPTRLVALAALAVIGLALIPLLRRDAVARFWGLGQVLALIPLGAAPLSSRYTFFVGVGAMALLVAFVAWTFEGIRGRWPPIPHVAGGALAVALVVLHVTVSPARLARTAGHFTEGTAALERSAEGLAPDAAVPDQRVIVVKAPRDVFVVLGVLVRSATNQPISRRTLALTYTTAPVRVSRVDDRTVVVSPEGPQEFLIAQRGLRPGETITLTGVTFRVDALSPDGRPLETRVTFDVPLEDRALKWVRWSDSGAYVPFTPPAMGQTVLIR